MGKKQVAVSLRKPPPADPDAFVAGGGDGQTSASAEQRAAEGPNVVTRVGERRELTVYLPVALARQLSVRCVELDRDVSSLVAESLVKTLAVEETTPSAAAALPPAPAPSVFDRWARARALVSQFRARLPLGLA
jgi:NAD(P)-dependent dehydrogenase (short-subunit alcohol dehydrogenase family)